MAIVSNKVVAGFDPELLLVGEGYIARPVTVNRNTISGLQPDERGNYVIPYGTYLFGSTGSSLLENPQQTAVAVVPTVTRASATVNTVLQITAKEEGNLAYTIELVEGVDSTFSVTVGGTGTAKTFEVLLPVDSSGNVTATYDDVVSLINNDMEANTYIVASIASGKDGTTVAADTSSAETTSGGGSETVSSDIDGILYHSVDVTNGEATGAMIISAYIDVDKMPSVPGAAVKAKLPRITFARKD